jgi:Ca2+-dependent lipid-binding protein
MQECKKVTLGSHVKWRGTGRKRTLKTVKDTFVYVPVLESLQNLLKIDGVFEEVSKSNTIQV